MPKSKAKAVRATKAKPIVDLVALTLAHDIKRAIREYASHVKKAAKGRIHNNARYEQAMAIRSEAIDIVSDESYGWVD